LTDAAGFPLMVEAFEGNKAETLTMLPTIRSFMDAHRLTDVTVVADAGMISAANQNAIEETGLSFILGARISEVPYVVAQWRRDHPDEQIPDGYVFTQPWPAGPADKRRDQVIYYQYKADRARRSLRGIDEQIAKAEKAVAGKVAVKRNRFIKLTGATKTVNRQLEANARALAGLKGYVTNLEAPTAEYVLGAYHQLWQIEKSFRMSKSDLRARPIYHHKRDSIEAHLTIVMAALAVSRWLERQTRWSIRKIVQTLRPYRSIAVQTGGHILHAGTPLDDQARAVLNAVKNAADVH
jgi:transposase